MPGPLTDTDLASINDNLNLLLVADEEIKLAAQAGLDVESQRELVRSQRAQLIKIKQTYFPGQ